MPLLVRLQYLNECHALNGAAAIALIRYAARHAGHWHFRGRPGQVAAEAFRFALAQLGRRPDERRRELRLKQAEALLSAGSVRDAIRAGGAALRLARGATDRPSIIKFDGGYHGHSDSLLVKAGSGLATQAIASSAGVPGGIARHTLVAPLDDEEAVRAIVSRTLTRLGYEVTATESADAALGLSDEELTSYALIVSDVVMPGRSGIELAQILRDRIPGLPVLLMSGYTEHSVEITEGLPEGRHFIAKPFTPIQLGTQVSELLRATGGRG